jgi:hypothetical protein
VIHLFVAALVVGWFGLFVFLLNAAFNGPRWLVALAIFCTLSLAGLFAASDMASQKGPCIRYEYGYQAKGGAYRYCVERGERIP